MKAKLLSVLLIMSLGCTEIVRVEANNDLLVLIDRYNSAIVDLDVPRLQLGYLDNLNGILDQASRDQQLSEFTAIKISLAAINPDSLEQENRYRYRHLGYRVDMNLRRIDLENRFREEVPGKVQATDGIYHQPLGKQWYRYFLDSWLSIERDPAELFAFGEREVLKVQSQILEVQEQTGYAGDESAFYRFLNEDGFLLHDEQQVAELYRRKAGIVADNLGKLFVLPAAPDIRIVPFPDSDKDTPPGQFVQAAEPTFWFNFFQDRHNIQDMDFLVLHEVIPGHWYHAEYDRQYGYDTNGLSVIWNYHGLSEGWGAYVEELGNELGLYQQPTDLMGKLNFDLVRSARVVLDVGINFYGWDNDMALVYWRGHIKGQDAIAQREIDRVRRWPGQAISYKVGADTFLRLRAEAELALGKDFDVREFHHQILGFGGVPLFLVEQRVHDYINAG